MNSFKFGFKAYLGATLAKLVYTIIAIPILFGGMVLLDWLLTH